MIDPVKRISEPLLPEHQLLREVGTMPQLSGDLRSRVVVDIRRQVRYGRWADRLRIAAAVLAASLLVCLVWKFRWTGQDQVAEQKPVEVPAPVVVPAPPSSGIYSNSPTSPAEPAKVPQGGPSSVPDMREMQQLNRLIEDIQGRNNILCGLVPIW
jgi:hypothetical protein